MSGPLAGNEGLMVAVFIPIWVLFIGWAGFFSQSRNAALKLRIARPGSLALGLLFLMLVFLLSGLSLYSVVFSVFLVAIVYVTFRGFAICPTCGVTVTGGTAGFGFSSPKYCSCCGDELPKATVNCPACGALVKSSETEVTPTSVSWSSGPVSLLSRRPYCPNCGSAVTFIYGSPPDPNAAARLRPPLGPFSGDSVG